MDTFDALVAQYQKLDPARQTSVAQLADRLYADRLARTRSRHLLRDIHYHQNQKTLSLYDALEHERKSAESVKNHLDGIDL